MTQWKECNLVMLPTEDKTNITIALHYNNETRFVHYDYKCDPNDEQYQHLYFTSDDEIKEGDWFYNSQTNKVIKAKVDENHSLSKKIISSTDESLTKKGTLNINKRLNYPLPQIPQSFIEKYVELGGIDKVLVEYEKTNKRIDLSHGFDDGESYQFDWKLKTDSHNTITIKEVK